MSDCNSMYGRSTAAPQLGKMPAASRFDFSQSTEAYQ